MFECPIAGGLCIGIPFNVTGKGVSVASASPNPVSFGDVPINTTVSQAVKITVDAGYAAELASGTGINLPFHFDLGTCGGTGGTCTVNESFTPTALGAASGTTTVFECPIAGGLCIGIPFNVGGTGVSVAAASPSAVDFGQVSLGASRTTPVTITADTGYTVQLASGSGLNPPFSFAFGTCSSFAGPGTCVVQETFAPTLVGPANGTLNVFECPNAGGTCIGIPVSLTGTGVLNATTTKIASSPNPSKVGQAVTFTATVTAATGPTPPLGSGAHTITAAYAGDSAHAASSASLTQTVQRLKSSTSLHSSDSNSTVGEAVTFTATVSGPGATPTGTVTFADGSPALGTVTLSGGRASLTTSALTQGHHDIIATYNGDATFAPSSDDLDQRVRLNDSHTSLRSSPSPSGSGEAVTFTATVSAPGPTPTGTVTFADGSHTLGTVTLSGGTASLTTSTLSTGAHSIRASYSGSDADRSSSDSVTQVVRRR